MPNDIEFDLEKGFPMQEMDLKEIANITRGRLIGDNLPVKYLGSITSNRHGNNGFLTYAMSQGYFQMFLDGEHEAAIVNANLMDEMPISSGKSIIVVDNDADTAFFSLHQLLAKSGIFPRLKSSLGKNCIIHPSAQIYDGVVIGDEVEIDANAVIYPNTVIDDGSRIKANAVVGGRGFEFKYINGKKTILEHVGGVYIGKNVDIGSCTTIDCGLMGNFTIIKDGAKIDNLIHVAHAVEIGEDCSIIACSELSGNARLGKGVWFAPSSCTNPEVVIGDFAFIGTGSVVVKDVPAFALVYGNPAKQNGWMCKCHKNRLTFVGDTATCSCGKEYLLENNHAKLIKE